MIDTVVKLLPALLGIALGYLLRLRGVAERRDADFMFRLIITVFLPALAFTALSRVSIDRNLAIFPLAALVIITVDADRRVAVGRAAARCSGRLPG